MYINNLKNSSQFKFLAPFSDQKCTYEKVTKNLGSPPPPAPHSFGHSEQQFFSGYRPLFVPLFMLEQILQGMGSLRYHKYHIRRDIQAITLLVPTKGGEEVLIESQPFQATQAQESFVQEQIVHFINIIGMIPQMITRTIP